MSRLALGCLAVAWLAFATPTLVRAEETPLPSTDTLVGFFDDLAFGIQTGEAITAHRPAAIRVRGDARFVAVGAAATDWSALLATLADTVSQATGRTVTLDPRPDADGPQPENGLEGAIEIHVAEGEAVLPLLVRNWISGPMALGLSRAPCVFVTRGRADVTGALVVVRADLPTRTIEHCLVEEITQTFGLFADSARVTPSMFNDFGLAVPDPADLPVRLTLADRLMLRVLYDPALTEGQSRDDALAAARTVIESVRATMDADGETALRHPDAGG